MQFRSCLSPSFFLSYWSVREIVILNKGTNMNKKIQLTDFEKYLITQAIETYKEQLHKMEFSPKSIVTKEYVESFLESIQEKLK